MPLNLSLWQAMVENINDNDPRPMVITRAVIIGSLATIPIQLEEILPSLDKIDSLGPFDSEIDNEETLP
jgi:hypothetical protein